MSTPAFEFEAALAFVISLRPRMAVEDADAAARRLLTLVKPDPLQLALAAGDLTQVALLSPVVMDAIRSDKKILAIKELRTITGCHLKEAKEAVEVPEVEAHYPVTGDYARRQRLHNRVVSEASA